MSSEQFSVCLDQAFIWLGYTRKDTAKDKLFSMFEEGLDYIRESPEYVFIGNDISYLDQALKIVLGLD